MCEEEKEKPDWLSDLQNNQKYKRRENFDNSLELNNSILTYASPRYGRRSIPGTKSVDNSPTKGSSNESKTHPGRSNSARPSLTVRDEFISKVKEADNAFNNSMEVLRDDFEKLSIHNFLGDRKHRRNDHSQKFIWDGSWNSETLNAQKGKSHEKIDKINTTITDNREKSIGDFKWERSNLRRQHSEKTQLQNKPGRGDATEKQQKEFIIPELPKGKQLVVNIKTTWGDKHLLGLNGIEIFNSRGKKPQIKSISANLDNLDCSKDPKYIEHLIDDIYLTQDDMHMWLAPYTPHSSHLITIEFDKPEELAMLRIWNYNKSRIHCNRGVKDVEIKLDTRMIFIGEIAMASGEILNTLSNFGDTILFTTDEDILEMVADNDEYFNDNTFCSLEDSLTMEEMRPLTGGNGKTNDITKNSKTLTDLEKQTEEGSNEAKKLQRSQMNFSFENEIESNDLMIQERVKEKISENDSIFGKSEFFDETGTLYIPSVFTEASDSLYETLSMPTGFNFTIQIHSTWGDLYYVGLNGVQMFDENGVEIKLHPNNVRAHPESVNILEGIENDARTPDKLVDGVYETMDGYHMWLSPVLPLTLNLVEFTFQNSVTLSSMKLWNYSKTPGRGVREFGILVDGLLIYNGELDQAAIMASDGLPRIPCKTINFSNGGKINEDFIKPHRTETSAGPLNFADQSKRPLTTMTNHS